MSEHPKQLPEGALIADALKRSRLSARKAAGRAGMSEGRWRQIVKGYQTVSAGTHAPVRGPAETVARMAEVVGVTPEQLEQADRADAADELRTLLDARAPADDLAARVAELRAEADRLEREADRLDAAGDTVTEPDLEHAHQLLARAHEILARKRAARDA